MRPGRRQPGALRLVVILVLLLAAIYLLWRLFIAVAPAPAPEMTLGGLSGRPPVHVAMT